MRLSELLDSMRYDGAMTVASVDESWLQGRSAFGGLQAAIAVSAMRVLIGADAPLRVLQVTFIAPVLAGEVRARAQVLRAGKNVTHVQARIENTDGELLALFIGVFGAARPSIVQRQLQRGTEPGQPVTHLPFMAGITPNFMQQFDVQLREGALPFSGQHVGATNYELGLKDEGLTTESHLLAIADFVPPVALSWMKGPTPGSSLTWMLELLRDDYQHLPLQGWRIDADLTAARDGYTSQSTTIYGPDGSAVALSRQSMVVFG